MSGLTAWERWELSSLEEGGNQSLARQRHEAAQQSRPETFTAEEAERLRQQAKLEGYQAGYQEGQSAARQEAQRLGQAAGQLEAALVDLERATAEELLALTIELARQVVRREISARPEAVLDVVKEMLAQLPHQHAVIYLHPEDAALVRSHLGETLTHAGHRIHEDAKLQRGGCLLESGSSQMDGTLATRWKRVLESAGLSAAWTDEASS